MKTEMSSPEPNLSLEIFQPPSFSTPLALITRSWAAIVYLREESEFSFKKINFSFFVINAASSSCQLLLRDLRSCNESAAAIVSVMSRAWKEVRAPWGERACAGRPDRSLPRKRWPLPQPPGWTGHPTGRHFPAPEHHPLRARTAPEGRPWPE